MAVALGVIPQFPASIATSSGITVTVANGIFTFGLDLTQITNVRMGTATTPPADAVLTINQNTTALPSNGRGANERWPFQIGLADGCPGGYGVDVFAYGPGASYGNGPTNPNPMWAGAFAVFDFRRANGSAAAPLPLRGGDFIGVLGSIGYVGGGYTATGYSYGAAQYRTYADGDWTTTNQPSRHEWLSTAPGVDSLNIAVRMRLQQGLRIGGGMTPTDTPGANDPGDGVIWPAKGVKGTTTNDSASVGITGEHVLASVAFGSQVALTTNTDLVLTSISLTAGDWDVWATGVFLPAASTTTTFMGASITTGSTYDTTAGAFAQLNFPAGTVLGATNNTMNAGPHRVSLAATTTINVVVKQTFGTSTSAVWGRLRARRVR